MKRSGSMFDEVAIVKQVTPTEFSMRQAEKAKTVAPKPLFELKERSDEEIEKIQRSLIASILSVVTEVIQRGYFERRDIEAISGAQIGLITSKRANTETFRMCSALNQVLDRLMKIIEVRERLEITGETAQRMRQIENVLMELTRE